MVLDDFIISRLIVQIKYPAALELWDRAGRLNRKIMGIWPGLQVVPDKTAPNQVVLKSSAAQIDTGLDVATLSLARLKTIDNANSQRIVETFEAWRNELELKELTRVSSRAIYSREFTGISEANKALFKLIGHQPIGKVFDQPEDSPNNTVDVAFRFEDDDSFAFLRVRTEQVTFEIQLDPDFSEIQPEKKTVNKLIIDFDRGLKKTVDARNLRMDDWLKGFQHLLRRDLEKVIKGR